MSERRESCQWRNYAWEEPGYYETECGKTFQFSAGDTLDNEVNYCFYCGGKVTAKHIEEDNDQDED